MTNSQAQNEQQGGTAGERAGHELAPTNFEREDDRWRWQNQVRDWLILLVMVVIYLVWTGVVYFFEPGIR